MPDNAYTEYVQLRKQGVGGAPPPSPHASDVRLYADTGGALRSLQSDGTDAAVGGGGGSTPQTRASYSMTGTVAAGTTANAAWNNPIGDALLDLTDPANPVISEAGVYALSCSFGAFPHTAPGPTDAFYGAIVLDPLGIDPVLSGSSYVLFQWMLDTIDTAVLSPQLPAAITGYVPATTGPVFQIDATYSAVDIDYEINALLQRVG